MGRKLPAQFIPADDETDVFEVLQEAANGDKTVQQKRLDDVLSELNDTTDDAEIKVYRQSDLGGKSSMVYLCTFPVDQYSVSELQEYLRQNYGGGNYRIHVRQGGKVKANKLVSIEAPKVSPVQGVSPIGEASNILATVLERMEKQNQMIMQLMQAQNQPQTSRREMLDELLLYKQLFDNGDRGGAQNGLQQLRDSLSILGELGVEIGGAKKDDEPGFADLLEKMTPLLGTVISNNQNNQNPQRKNDPMFAQKMMIKSGMVTLMKAAAKNADTITYAEMLFDQLPEATIREFITAPGAFEKLIKIEPKAAHFRPWFEDLAEHVKGQLGMPSKYSDLYTDDDPAINGESIATAAPDDGTD